MQFIGVFLIIVVTTAIVAFYPYLFGKLIDALFYDKNISMFVKIVLIYLVIYIINQILHYRLDIMVAKLGIQYSFDIKKNLLHKVLTYKSRDLSNLNTGDIISRVNKDAEEPLNFIYHDIFYGLSAFMDFLMCFGIIAFINSTLAIIMLIMSLVAFLLSKYFEAKLAPLYKNIIKQRAKNSNWLFEVLNGMRDLKLIFSVDRCFDKYMKTETEIVDFSYRIAKKEIMAERVNDGVKLISTIIIYFFAAAFIIQNMLTLGGLVACVDYFNRMMLMMDRIYARIFRVSKRMASIDRVMEIEDFDSENDLSSNEQFDIAEGEVVFDAVTFAYEDNKKVLDQINLSIRPGERIALVGRSGEGKSTIAQLICRLYEVNQGEIRIDGKNINEIDVHSLRRQIGIVNQNAAIFSNTIRYNLIFSNKKERDHEIWEVLKQVEMDKVIAQLPKGLDTYLTSAGLALSGGQYQRLAIARAYLKKAAIMIFDESTSAIDGHTEESIIQSWNEMFKNHTVIVIAHRFSTIMNCDRVAVLENGKIVACDIHDTLVNTCESYRKLFYEQSHYFA